MNDAGEPALAPAGHPSLIAMVTSMVTASPMIYNTGGVEEHSGK